MGELLYTVPASERNPKGLRGLLSAHPEVRYVSLSGVDLGGNDTDEKIPVSHFLEHAEEYLAGGVQTDGSSVVLPGIATLNDGKVDLVADPGVRWYVDHNHENTEPATGLPVGTLRIPSFLKHGGRFIDSRAILRATAESAGARLAAMLSSHPAAPRAAGIDPTAVVRYELIAATELEFWVRTPGASVATEMLSVSQILQESYWKRTKGAVRSALEASLALLERYGLGPEMGHKEVGGIKATVSGGGGLDGIMEQLEVDWRYAEALQAADNELLARIMIKETFRRHGLEVVFTAKPMEGVAGSGEHTHLSIMAVLTQDVPAVRLFPQSSEQLEDQATAKTGSTIIELVERNNRAAERLNDIAFACWCDGKVGAYVRYVVDGSRFGYHPEDEIAERQVKLGEDAYICPQCQTENPAAASWGMCARCGAELGDENLRPAEVLNVPQVQQTTQVANGAEVVTIVGGLELRTPTWTEEQHEYPYLQWATEAHKARLRAAYPHAAEKIIGPGSNAQEDAISRTSRLEVKAGGQASAKQDAGTNLVTFTRTWFRPWAFYLMEDRGKRDQLLQLFPEGCMVAFAGDAYCESRAEGMDDHWKVMHAMPGDGQNRPGMGDVIVSVNERFNDLTNLQMEITEYGIPTVYADEETLDFDALQDTTVEPGAHYPVTRRAGEPLSASFYESRAGQMTPDAAHHMMDLMGPIAQFLTGAFPALFGGRLGGNDTAAGYAMARDQALGRLGLVWRRIKHFWADAMMMAVECFRRNRPDDVEVPIFGQGGEFTSKWIRSADLKGNIFAYPESDEHYPAVRSAQMAVVTQLLGMKDPLIEQVFADPENLDFLKRLTGLTDLVIPDEDSRRKQYREIEQMLNEQAQPVPDPVSGQPTGNLMPSVLVDQFGDNHAVELATVKHWMNSDEGQAAKTENPDGGYANVRAHGILHEQYLRAAEMQQAIVAQARPPAPEGKDGAVPA